MDMCSNDSIVELLNEEMPLDLSAHIETVNSNPKSTWVAGVNSKFEGASLNEIRSLMGTVVDPDWVIRLPELNEPRVFSDASMPDTFDARTNWPDCEPVINHVRD